MAGFDPRKALHWSAFFVAWLLSGQAAHADSCSMPPSAAHASVRHVIDGDTLELVDGRRVRLIGIDTPEIGRQGKPSEPFAEAARDRLRELAGGRVRLVEGLEPKDRHGRALAYLFDPDGRSLEAALLREGLGFALALPPNVSMAGCHASAERVAREARRGLWQSSPVVAATALQAGGFQLVRAQIRQVERAGRYFWLETDGLLVLRVDPQDLPALGVADVQGLRGRSVIARGWVIDRRREGGVKAGFKPFMLPVRHSLMLELQ